MPRCNTDIGRKSGQKRQSGAGSSRLGCAKSGRNVMAIPDLHAPFSHPDAAEFVSRIKERYAPTDVVLLGDVVDLHGLSRFTRDPNGYSSGHEYERAMAQLQPLYEEIGTATVTIGNHDRRLADRSAEAGVPASALKSLPEWLGCPSGWEWVEQTEIDGVVYEHGDGYSGRDAHVKAANANMCGTVIGHIHAHAGISYVSNRRHLFWGFNAGCLIDPNAYAFAYARKLSNRPIIGVGLIECGVPRFVPMMLKKGGRWNGKV